MRATLTFDIRDPDDRSAFARASRADDICFAVMEFLERVRTELKYGSDGKMEAETLEAARAWLLEELEERGVNLEVMS